eukprot:12324481-Alexandrium_andersonii.AAC.1
MGLPAPDTTGPRTVELLAPNTNQRRLAVVADGSLNVEALTVSSPNTRHHCLNELSHSGTRA